jgi:hypothetical protein
LRLRESSVELELLTNEDTFSLEFLGLRESVDAYDPLPPPLFLKLGGRKASMADLATPTSC